MCYKKGAQRWGTILFDFRFQIRETGKDVEFQDDQNIRTLLFVCVRNNSTCRTSPHTAKTFGDFRITTLRLQLIDY